MLSMHFDTDLSWLSAYLALILREDSIQSIDYANISL